MMHKFNIFSFSVILLTNIFTLDVFAHDYKTTLRVDDHAPIGVMRDHVHKKGEFMSSYRFSYMNMQGLRDGNNQVSSSAALQEYSVAPRKMTMQMHMLGMMYGVTDRFTVAFMNNFTQKDMDHIHKTKGYFNRKSEDIGDMKLNALYEFYHENGRRMQFNLGVSLPTGDIDKEHGGTRLPYAMQIGSGSYELLPGISYSGHSSKFSYGGQLNAIFRLDSNKHDYKLGDSYNITAWAAKKINEVISVSSRLDYNKYEAIEGKDAALDNMVKMKMNPAVKTNLQSKERLDLLFGSNILIPQGAKFAGHRLALEIGVPIYQRIDGPMLETDYKIMLGWQNQF